MDIANKTQYDIDVSVSVWDSKEENPSWYTINPDGKEKWGRKDPRGYLLAVKKEGAETLYYVRNGAEIAVHDNDVYDKNIKVPPAHSY